MFCLKLCKKTLLSAISVCPLGELRSASIFTVNLWLRVITGVGGSQSQNVTFGYTVCMGGRFPRAPKRTKFLHREYGYTNYRRFYVTKCSATNGREVVSLKCPGFST